ncbi:MAG: S46 family peptidase, partial [Deltaproteobacteria bacterium]|nr:S46 family peptidase [Deltaproteobacteria bacterium]
MRTVLVAVALLSSASALAMEGHWRPAQLPELASELEALGVALPPEQLSDVTAHPLGAIVDMEFCSGAFVSPDGLIATAYHCVTDGLQYASGSGEDLFEDGFHALRREQERWAGPDMGVRVTTEVRDVTDDALAGTRKLQGTAALDRIEANIKTLVRRCESGPDVHCEVATYGGGADYELITQLALRDVRVVYAPPRAVGYFGGDDDNWRWPRHSGDFAFLRAYVSPSGRSTEHHPANVAYHPPLHLPIAKDGAAPGEVVMVAGYPNGTYRWRSAAELDYAQEELYPVRIQVRRDMLAIIEGYMERDKELAAKLAPRRLNLSNDVVYYEGTLAQFLRAGTVEEKWQFEEDLARWIAADEERSVAYGTVLDTVHRLQAEEAATGERDYIVRQMVRRVDMLKAATEIYKLSVEASKSDKDREGGYQNRDRPHIANELDQMDARHDWRVDRDLLRYFLHRTMTLPSGMHVPELDNWLDHDPEIRSLAETIDAKLDELYDNIDLADSDKRRDLMGTSTWYLERSDNPWFTLAAALHPYLKRVEQEERERDAEWRQVKPRYISAVQEFIPEGRPRYLASTQKIAPGVFYPDANRTLRVSVGKVDGYFPRDGLIAAPHTTLEGIVGKSGLAPYDTPRLVLEAIAEGSYGPYADPRIHSVPVNFVTSLDTARGSSGSATMNGRGEFVGIIFDGNYEAIASDWIFDEAMTRSIHTDVRYMLWYLDRCAG